MSVQEYRVESGWGIQFHSGKRLHTLTIYRRNVGSGGRGIKIRTIVHEHQETLFRNFADLLRQEGSLEAVALMVPSNRSDGETP